MKIKQIETRAVRMPVKPVYKSGSMHKFYPIVVESVIVRITTDDGVVGLGEGNALPERGTGTIASVKDAIDRYLGPLILGEDPFAIGPIHTKMNVSTTPVTGIVGYPAAKAAIDMACYDIMGKATGQPVYKLLGGPHRTKFKLNQSLRNHSMAEDLDALTRMLSDGYTIFKIDMDVLDADANLARIIAIREKAGPAADLRLHYHENLPHGYALAGAVLRRQCEIRPTFIEQPLPRWDLTGLARLSAVLPAPIAADESLYTPHDALTIASRDAARVYVLKVAKHGGLYPAKQIANIGQAAGLVCSLSTMQETSLGVAATLHLGACIQNALPGSDTWGPTAWLQTDLVKNPPRISNGEIYVPDGPGLGVDIDEEVLKKFTIAELNPLTLSL